MQGLMQKMRNRIIDKIKEIEKYLEEIVAELKTSLCED